MLGLSDPLHDSADAIADIVFVHGLQGDRVKTWTDEPTERPIILVVHSLGGLALLSGDNSPDEFTRKVSSSVKRIAFMGTSHRGSDKAKWAETGRNLLDYIMDTNSELLKVLEENSERLSIIGREFPNLLRRRKGKPEEKIVPESSACLAGYPAMPIHADHSGMCKFEDKEDPNYRKVAGVLKRWIQELGTPSTEPKVEQVAIFGDINQGQQCGQLNMEGGTLNFGTWLLTIKYTLKNLA
ncbi:hypothetical protein K469DRAFT_728103 [Zopfia rhizophila CBS 207.26]|uniref:DUF676 domain-containing protein n=1 Tax=Zopfia rhizophila CBS 207.26 TaxID=1314779 RepID=A0A6A6DYS4_9PEZI|nr:hypothetical protein K469DRAFT_728103 [Zopfia rhizophila CBS 207.26]